MASNGMKIAIVGGGLAGLAAAMKIAEGGHAVDLFSVVPVKRSHSVCAQGGINGAVNTKGEGDSTWKHFDDTVYGGDFLEEDLESGYVRVLQELIAAGWSDPDVAGRVLVDLRGWLDVLTGVAGEAEGRFGPLGPLRAEDVAGLIGLAFLGGEAVILLGDPNWGRQARGWLRSVGQLIRVAEEAQPAVATTNRRRKGK